MTNHIIFFLGKKQLPKIMYLLIFAFLKSTERDFWVGQSVKCPTLALGSGCDLGVVSPVSGSELSGESA